MAWRLVFSDGGFDYETVFHCMTWDEILDANAALDLLIESRENRRAADKARSELRSRTGRR